MENKYFYRRVGTTGCELIDPDGNVFAWTVDEATAAIICRHLNDVDLPDSTVDVGVTMLSHAARCSEGQHQPNKKAFFQGKLYE